MPNLAPLEFVNGEPGNRRRWKMTRKTNSDGTEFYCEIPEDLYALAESSLKDGVRYGSIRKRGFLDRRWVTGKTSEAVTNFARSLADSFMKGEKTTERVILYHFRENKDPFWNSWTPGFTPLVLEMWAGVYIKEITNGNGRTTYDYKVDEDEEDLNALPLKRYGIWDEWDQQFNRGANPKEMPYTMEAAQFFLKILNEFEKVMGIISELNPEDINKIQEQGLKLLPNG